MGTESLTARNSRRALLAGAVAGATALAAERLARPPHALAADGDPVVLGGNHTSTRVTNITGGGLRLEGGALGFALLAHGLNNESAILGSSVAEGTVTPESTLGSGVGVAGDSGSGSGVRGTASTGTGVDGHSQSGAGVAGNSQSGPGVVGHSQTGPGGTLSTNGGDFAAHISGNAVEFALGVDNSLAGDRAGGILAVSRGGKPAIEGDVFPSEFSPGVGLQGVAYSGTSYENGEYGEGPGTGVEGISGDGGGVVGRSQRGSGLIGFAGGGPDISPPYGVPGLGHLGVAGFAPLGDDPFGIGALGTGQVGVHGFGGLFGVDGRAENAIAGNFVNYAASEAGAALRAISPGDRPAVIAWSGNWPKSDEDIMPPDAIVSDGGIALEVLGKARFSTAGASVVPQGTNSVFVANMAVTASSHITVTLTGDPGNRQVRWVGRTPGSGFSVNLSPAPPNGRPQTPFTYLIVEPMT